MVHISIVLLLRFMHSGMLGGNTVLLTVSVLSWRPVISNTVKRCIVQKYLRKSIQRWKKAIQHLFFTIKYYSTIFNSTIILIKLSNDLWQIKIKYRNKCTVQYSGTPGTWKPIKQHRSWWLLAVFLSHTTRSWKLHMALQT